MVMEHVIAVIMGLIIKDLIDVLLDIVDIDVDTVDIDDDTN